MKRELRPRTFSAVILASLVAGAFVHAAQPWRHRLSYPRGGYWRVRVPVDVRNTSDRDFEGEPVRLRIDKLGLADQAAEALRVVDAQGHELLFDIRDANGGFARAGKLTASDTLFLRVDCTQGQTARVWVYADNPAAMPVPDFLKPGFVNRGFEAGKDKPDGWIAWGNDDTHAVSWVTENPHSGKYCGKVVVQPGAKPTWVKWTQQRIPLVPGTKYRVRAWVKAQGVKGRVGWFIHVNGERPQMINRSMRTLIDGGSHDWQEVGTEFTCPEGANNLTIGTLLHGTGIAYFDDASVEALTEAAGFDIAVGRKETLTLNEVEPAEAWRPGPSASPAQWPCRAAVTTLNFSDAARNRVVVRADLSRPLFLVKRSGHGAALRVVDPTGGRATVLPHTRTKGNVMFVGDLPPRSVKRFYVYFSARQVQADVRGVDLASLVRSPANLVKNGDMEADDAQPAHWEGAGEGAPPAPFVTKLATGGIVGDRCLELQIPKTTKLGWLGWHQNRIPVKPNAAYLYAGYLRTKDVTDGKVQLYGHFKTADNTLASTPYFGAGPHLAGNTDWTLCSGVALTPADCTAVDLHLTMNAHGTVWHDGLLLCEVVDASAGALEPATPSRETGRAYDVWEVNPLVKVFPDDPPGEPIRQLRLAAARNEREPVQIVVRPTRPLTGFDVRVTALRSAAGHVLPAVDVARVGYVPIDHLSSYYSSKLDDWYRKVPNRSGRTDGWAGEWPDPVPPFSKMDLPAGRNLPLWLTVHVPADAKPGEYRGSLRLSTANAPATVLPLSLTVWDFTLPKVSHLKVIYDLRRGPRGGVFGGADPKARLRTWYRFLAERRVSPGILYPRPKLTCKDGKVSMDFTDFDEMAAYCFDELGINVIYTPWYFYAFGWSYKPRKFAGFDAFTPEYEKAFTDAYRLFMAHLKDKGWYDKVVYYISDEPHFRHDFVVEQMKKMCDLAHHADPNVPIYSSTWRHVPQWNGYLDIWGVGQYGCFPVEEMDRRIADGEKLWFTTDGQMATDTPYCGTERLLPYYCLKYGVEGYEFWGVSWWTYDPWKYGWHTFKRQSSDGKEYRWVRYPNGDGYLAYPGDAIGREEPVSTIRLEQAREGVEDYEYFVLLRDLIAQAKTARLSTSEADAALESVRALVAIPNPGGYRSTDIMPDPDAIPKVRRAVAKHILRMKQALRTR